MPPHVRSCLVWFVTWLAMAIGLYVYLLRAGVMLKYAHWGALLASGCLILVVSYSVGIYESVRDRALLAAAAPPVDGREVALTGRIRAREPLRAPFSGVECVAYDYSITRSEEYSDGTRDVICFEGKGVAPAVIDSRHGSVRLLSIPMLEMPMEPLADPDAVRRAREYIMATDFETSSTPQGERATYDKEITARDGAFRRDRAVHGAPSDLDGCRLEERCVRQGELVSAFGLYARARGALVPSHDKSKRTRLLRSDATGASSKLRTRIIWYAIGIVVFGAAAYGIVKAYTTRAITV